MTTLVTGGNGFVGSALVRLLLGQDHQVRVLVRSGSDRRNLENLDIDLAEGDLTDPASLQRAVRGCSHLFHAAADYRLWIPYPERMYRTNVDGTRDLLRAAADAGVGRMVYTSSVATLGINRDRSPGDETTPVSLADMVGHYKRSKFLAEQAVRELAQEQGLPVVIVNPSTPIGPRDVKPTPTGRIIVDTLRGKIPAYVDTGLNIAHVDDVAAGHLLALERGEPGRRYILGGENLSLQAILGIICNYAGLAPPRLRLPHNAVYPFAWLAEQWARVSGKEPFATVDGVKMAKKFMYFSSALAQQALGYKSRPARLAIEDAIDWFRENKYL
jgi:dihydroflavonol-4-reductase